ncbi:deaminase [Clostridium ljungdahlii]|uniref:deaminase n=1 Tax=Clostridium ljungdahlii TaxID=1538 RepID=UPI00386E8472
MKNNHCVRTIHAEVNCLLEVAPDDRESSMLYVTHMPCPECQKLIITCGIKRVVYCEEYTPEINWFEKTSGIELICIKR